ncbi:hypothetical protein C8R44DRAFT_210883 [Mycena epipterygia]|nr:hypothetical protein C8R44DRAFT_210883 [Mycena epipterygia]
MAKAVGEVTKLRNQKHQYQARIDAAATELSDLKEDVLAKKNEAESVRVALESEIMQLKERLDNTERNRGPEYLVMVDTFHTVCK